MNTFNLKVVKINKDAILPNYAHPGDAGLDIYSVEEKTLNPGERALIKTGIKIELPKNTEAQMRPRSGLALKHGISLVNSPGTIDEEGEALVWEFPVSRAEWLEADLCTLEERMLSSL